MGGTSCPIERTENQPDWEYATPCSLRGPGPETYWNHDWCHGGLRTTSRRDFSSPWMVCNSSKTERKGGALGECRDGGTFSENMSNGGQNVIFWRHVRSSKRSGDLSAGIGFFLNPIHKNFVQNLTSNMARSTLTSPSRNRGKTFKTKKVFIIFPFFSLQWQCARCGGSRRKFLADRRIFENIQKSAKSASVHCRVGVQGLYWM